tara:strand:+ start:234 stop:608 length:375 start_codon:yes stop_codon:yes gene_type:complete
MSFFDKIKKLDRRVPKKSSYGFVYKKHGSTKRETHLYTSGGEFSLVKPISEGMAYEYVGQYHIHNTKGPMEGSTHTSEPHRTLIPLTKNAADMIRLKVGFDCYPNDDYSTFVPQGNTNQGGGTY